MSTGRFTRGFENARNEELQRKVILKNGRL